MTQPELFAILEEFNDELSLKLTGMMGMFGGGISKDYDNSIDVRESSAEDVDDFFNNF